MTVFWCLHSRTICTEPQGKVCGTHVETARSVRYSINEPQEMQRLPVKMTWDTWTLLVWEREAVYRRSDQTANCEKCLKVITRDLHCRQRKEGVGVMGKQVREQVQLTEASFHGWHTAPVSPSARVKCVMSLTLVMMNIIHARVTILTAIKGHSMGGIYPQLWCNGSTECKKSITEEMQEKGNFSNLFLFVLDTSELRGTCTIKCYRTIWAMHSYDMPDTV